MALFLTKVRLVHSSGFFRKLSSSSEKSGLVLGVYVAEDRNILTPAAEKFDAITGGKLRQSLQLPQKPIKEGKSIVFWDLHPHYPSVAVVGLGKCNKGYSSVELLDESKEAIRCAASAGCRSLVDVGFKRIAVEDFADAEAAAEGSILGTWKFQEYSAKKQAPPTLELYEECRASCTAWNYGELKAHAQNVARHWADTPANLLTPTIFARNLCDTFQGLPVDVQVHDREWAERQQMGAYLAVTRGSHEPPQFVELTYRNAPQCDEFVVLVGKGVTFDAGGISLKPSANMDQMRADMGGAAACAAALHALCQLGLKANIKVLLPLCENLPSGNAIKPGDVVRAKNGKTICVDNTDAEGRLILADALCYSETFKPKVLVDVATLTGAMSVAIGSAAAGVFTTADHALYDQMQSAGATSGDRFWRFPLWKQYTKQLRTSPAFDLNNISKEKGGGSCTAAAFLREFVPKGVANWFHVDIASVMGPKDPAPYLYAGMTGRPTRALIEFIKSQC